MVSFFKSFGKGILYLLTLPLTIVVLAIFSVVGLFGFIYLSFKSIFLFFKGKTINTDLPEDIRAKEILNPTLNNEVKEETDVKVSASGYENMPFFYHPGVDETPNEGSASVTKEEANLANKEIEPEPIFTPIEDENDLSKEPADKEIIEEEEPFIPMEEPAPSFDPKIDDELDVIQVKEEEEIPSSINEDGVDISLPKYDGGTNSMFSADEDDVEFADPTSVSVDDLNKKGERQ